LTKLGQSFLKFPARLLQRRHRLPFFLSCWCRVVMVATTASTGTRASMAFVARNS
jgi:hypothetical protein